MTLEKEIVYLGHNNTVDLTITLAGKAIPIIALTKVELVRKDCGSVLASSVDHPGWFDWATRGAQGILTLRLKDMDIPAGTYSFWLKLYDPVNTDGLVWDELKIGFVETSCPIS